MVVETGIPEEVRKLADETELWKARQCEKQKIPYSVGLFGTIIPLKPLIVKLDTDGDTEQ